MAELVALDLAGDAFVDALLRAWDRGDAVLPLDPRSPREHTTRVLDALAPSVVIGPDDDRFRRTGGVPVEPGDAVVIATSGTTGEPKGAVHTHDGIAAAARMTAAATGSGASDARWLACLPLAHVGGLSVVTRALLVGADLEVHEAAEAGRIDDAAARGATHVSLVTTLLGRIDPSPWRVILLGGSAIPPDRPSSSIATYGMTETFGGVVYDGTPLDGVDVRIVGNGPEGPIKLRTPTAMRAYRHGPEGTVDPVGTDPRDDDGWFRTGDLGRILGDGVLDVSGRADDLIITGGSKVWPAPVEEVLLRHPSVGDVAVTGVADPEWGQRVVAVVVPAAPDSPPTLEELRAVVRAVLPVTAAPKELHLVDVLPRTSLGKIRRSTLIQGARKAEPDIAP